MQTRRLDGQVAIVTGGGRGLGRQTAQILAAEGAAVAVAARSHEQLNETVTTIEQAGGRALAFPLDVANADSVTGMVAEVERQLGSIDLLVNNAAVIPPLGPSWVVDPEEWWHLFEINVRGPFLCAHAVLPSMVARRRGRIVNVASGAGLKPPPFGSAYVTSKAAIIRFTEALALETAEHGIAVFAINPGWMSTAMTEYLAQSEAGQQWTPWAPSVFGSEAHVPIERSADLVLALALGKADMLSGRYVDIYDDIDTVIGRSEEIRQNDLHMMRLRT
jgi:NAD(P)-dependent dehydrogenase (short-subunit alcohol dehydrogenase family)